jgi:menaquinone-dependent protoporphyrinogen oxidase
MRVLAIYGTRYGQAELVTQRIADVLRSAGHHVTVWHGEQLPANLKPQSFDAYLLAASIIMQRYQRYMIRFAREHAGLLNSRPSAFVSINGTSPESSPEWRRYADAYVQKLRADTGWRPAHVGRFSGALRYPRYPLITRWMMRMISRHEGGPTDTSREYEFTDWAAVDRFATQLAAAWGGVEAPARR